MTSTVLNDQNLSKSETYSW